MQHPDVGTRVDSIAAGSPIAGYAAQLRHVQAEMLRTGTLDLSEMPSMSDAEYHSMHADLRQRVQAAGEDDLDVDEKFVWQERPEAVISRVAHIVRRGLRRGDVTGRRVPVAVVARRPVATPREHRSRSASSSNSNGASSGSRSPGRPRRSDDDDPSHRPCDGCGDPLGPGRPNRRHHGPNCRKLGFRARKRASADALIDRYREEILAARRRELLDGAEALTLQIAPSDRAAAALAIRELVACTFAAFDSGRANLARRAAVPIAREIFNELEASR